MQKGIASHYLARGRRNPTRTKIFSVPLDLRRILPFPDMGKGFWFDDLKCHTQAGLCKRVRFLLWSADERLRLRRRRKPNSSKNTGIGATVPERQ